MARPPVSAALLSLALAAPAAGVPLEDVSPAYEAALRRYASGDRQGAVAMMSAWPENRLRDEVTALRARAREGQGCRRCPVALMLHSDCAQRARADGRSPRPHESAAVEVANLMKDDPARSTFVRRWYEAMAGLAQGENRWGEALDWAEWGLRVFPDSAEMLLVKGSIEETSATLTELPMPAEPLADPGTRRARADALQAREARDHLEKAHRALASAVAAQPDLVEARLRLGRVAWRRGDAAEARSALRDVLERKPDASTAYLAHLFLGRLDEDDGRLEEAARSYEAALALDPRAQAARIARSHIDLRRGDAASARVGVQRAVEAAHLRLKQDPFWLYPWGPSVGVEERLEALRREASSP